jgi:hypothetical protein
MGTQLGIARPVDVLALMMEVASRRPQEKREHDITWSLKQITSLRYVV